MRSTKAMYVRFLSLAAVLVGGLTLSACGGGGTAPGGSTLILDGPVTTPPPPSGNLPDPIPMPDGEGGSPTPTDPAPVPPPADPPSPGGPPALVPDLARVSALAVISAAFPVVDGGQDFAGLYLADEDGVLWRRFEDGTWMQAAQVGLPVEAMTYVHTRQALYLAVRTNQGSALVRWRLQETPELQWLASASGALVRLQTTAGDTIPAAAQLTGLAFDTTDERLYAWDHDLSALFFFANPDLADATLESAVPFAHGQLADVQDLTYDRVNARMLVVDAARAELVELDHLGLAVHASQVLPYADVRALAWQEDGTRWVVDRASAALLHLDVGGTVLE